MSRKEYHARILALAGTVVLFAGILLLAALMQGCIAAGGSLFGDPEVYQCPTDLLNNINTTLQELRQCQTLQTSTPAIKPN